MQHICYAILLFKSEMICFDIILLIIPFSIPYRYSGLYRVLAHLYSI